MYPAKSTVWPIHIVYTEKTLHRVNKLHMSKIILKSGKTAEIRIVIWLGRKKERKKQQLGSCYGYAHE